MVELDTRRLCNWQDDDACVERSVTEPGNLGSCRCVAQFQAPIRSSSSEPSNCIGQSPKKRASDIAEPDAPRAPGCRFTRRSDRMIGLAQRLTRLMQKGQSGLGQAESAIGRLSPTDRHSCQAIPQPPTRD